MKILGASGEDFCCKEIFIGNKDLAIEEFPEVSLCRQVVGLFLTGTKPCGILAASRVTENLAWSSIKNFS